MWLLMVELVSNLRVIAAGVLTLVYVRNKFCQAQKENPAEAGCEVGRGERGHSGTSTLKTWSAPQAKGLDSTVRPSGVVTRAV